MENRDSVAGKETRKLRNGKLKCQVKLFHLGAQMNLLSVSWTVYSLELVRHSAHIACLAICAC